MSRVYVISVKEPCVYNIKFGYGADDYNFIHFGTIHLNTTKYLKVFNRKSFIARIFIWLHIIESKNRFNEIFTRPFPEKF